MEDMYIQTSVIGCNLYLFYCQSNMHDSHRHSSITCRQRDTFNVVPNLGLDTVKSDLQILQRAPVYTRNTLLISGTWPRQAPGQGDMEAVREVSTLTAAVNCSRCTGRAGDRRGRRVQRRLIEPRQGAVGQFEETIEPVILWFRNMQDQEPTCLFIVGYPFHAVRLDREPVDRVSQVS